MTDGSGVGVVRRCAWGRMSVAALRPMCKLVGALALSVLLAGMAMSAGSQVPSTKSTQSALPQTETRQPTREQIADFAALPLTFEKNMGQVDKRACYLSRMSNYTLFLSGSDSVLVHRGTEKNTASALKLRWLGASEKVTPQGDAELRGKSNYLIGNDRARWHSNVPNYQRVREDSLYPGVDLVYYGNHEQLEYDLTVAPGADPGAIRLAIDGAKSLSIDKASGDLVTLDQLGSELRFRKPVVYQQDGAQKNTVSGSYILSADHSVTFSLGAYDRAKPLVIDPYVVYSTIFGATTVASTGLPYLDQFAGMAVDNSGFVYLLDMTSTPGLPVTTGAYQTSCDIYDPGTYPAHFNSCSNFFVAKFDPTQSGAASLVYATYIGGSSFQETALAVELASVHALAVDADGDAYFTGHVTSSDYPTTANAYTSYTQACTVSTKATGYCDTGGVVVSKLDPTGATLLYSTYFANIWNHTYSEYVQSGGIAVDGNQIAYIWGKAPGGLPTTDGSKFIQANVEGDFVGAFNTTATAATGSTSLVYAEYFPMDIYGMAADPSGNLYLAGGYTGPFPTSWSTTTQTITINGFQAAPSNPTGPAPYAGELVKLNPQGVNTYATTIGTSGSLNSVSVNASGVAYTGGSINDGTYIYVIDTTQTGANSLVYSTLVANDFGGVIDDVSDNGEGLVAFSGVGYASSHYTQVNALTQPTSVPSTYYAPFAGIIDTTTRTTTFLSFIDGVDTTYPIDVILRRNPAETPPNYLYVGGSVANLSTFLPVASSYQTTGELSVDNPPFFYKISMALPPALTVTPNPLNFGNQCISTTSTTQAVTVTNIGSSAISMDSVTASSPYSETDDCISLSPLAGVPAGQTTGGSCTVNVGFSPTTTGPFTGTLTLTDSDTSSPQKVTLTGTGIQSLVTLTPSSQSFSATEGGTSAVQTITVTNTGVATISVSKIQMTGINAADFSATNNCPATLTPSPAAGSSCTISMTFNPSLVGTETAEITVTDTDQCTQQTAPLTGDGTAPAPIGLTINETIHVTDAPAMQLAQILKIAETIHTMDALSPIVLSKQLNIAEVIHASDALSPISFAKILNILETIHTTDTLAETKSTYLNIAETIHATDMLTPMMLSNILNINEQIHVIDSVAPVPVPLTTTIEWTAPAPITYGASLSGLLNATAWNGTTSVAGSYAYTAAPTGGSASPVTSATVLAAGSYTLGVTFTPSIATEYTTATGAVSLTVNLMPPDFSLTIATTGKGGSKTVLPGGKAVFDFVVSPLNATTFPAPVTLSASGLPAGTTYSISPASLPAGSGSSPVTLTIQLLQNAAAAHSGNGLPNLAPFALALLLLPFAGRLRRAGKRLGRWLALLLLLAATMAAVAGISACGSTSGFFAQRPETYTVTVTGSSGAVSHSATVTLTVE